MREIEKETETDKGKETVENKFRRILETYPLNATNVTIMKKIGQQLAYVQSLLDKLESAPENKLKVEADNIRQVDIAILRILFDL